MKKTIFTFLAVAVALSGAFAQLVQGTKIVGGDFGLEFSTSKSKYNNQTVTTGNSTSFTLEPKFGYFVIDNLAVGGELSISSYTSKYEDYDGKSTGTSIAIGPFVRYYFPPKIFVEAKYAVGTAKYKDDFFGDMEESKYALSAFSLGAGYAAFINENIAIEPMLGYQLIGQKNKTDNEPAVKNTDGGLFIRVGFQIYLH
jgi:hypothetical protein